MTSQVFLISCLMGALASAGTATTSDPFFNWAKVGNKSFLPPLEEPLPKDLNTSRCYERGVAAAMQGAMAAALNEPGYHINLSEQYIFQCNGGINSNICNSGTTGKLDPICDTINNHGVTDEACVPIDATNLSNKCTVNNCTDITSRLVKPRCEVSSTPNMGKLKDSLLNNGPVAVTLNFFESFKDYKSGVYHPLENEVAFGRFLVTLVGWELDTSTNKTNFILRNEYWGDSWGDKGFFKISQDDILSLVCDDTDVCFAAENMYFDFSSATLPGHICIDDMDTLDLGEVNKFIKNEGKTVTIRNCGKKQVRWNVSSKSSSPLVFTPADGSLDPGIETELNIKIDLENDNAVEGPFNGVAYFNTTMGFPTELQVKANIIKPQDPVVDFIASNYAGYAPLKVTFNTDIIGEDYVNSVEWNFGEASATSTSKTAEYTYHKKGVYTVTLTAKWAGEDIVKTKKITVYAPKGESGGDKTQEVKTGGCNSTSSPDFAIWAILAILCTFIPYKRLN